MSIRDYYGYNQHKADLNMKAHIKSCSLGTAGFEGSTVDISCCSISRSSFLRTGNSVRISNSWNVGKPQVEQKKPPVTWRTWKGTITITVVAECQCWDWRCFCPWYDGSGSEHLQKQSHCHQSNTGKPAVSGWAPGRETQASLTHSLDTMYGLHPYLPTCQGGLSLMPFEICTSESWKRNDKDHRSAFSVDCICEKDTEFDEGFPVILRQVPFRCL